MEALRSQPLVSVIIPLYNHERFVAQAIRSVWAQTYPHLELIVIDDGSTDGSSAVVERELESGPPRPTRFLRQPNSGAHEAMNRGVTLAKGKYVAFLNSDDLYHPDRIETLVEAAERGQDEVLFTLLDVIS